MGLKEKVQFLINNPRIILEYYKLQKDLRSNKSSGKYNFVFQCDAVGHFPHIEPYYNIFKNEPGVEIYFSAHRNGATTHEHFLRAGISENRIIKYIELIRLTEWDIYMSPTSFGNVFPKNQNCPRIQIFHTLARKKRLYGESLRNFNVIFLNGAIHHDFLEKDLFGQFPKSRTHIKTYNVGYAKIDDLLQNSYSIDFLKNKLGITPNDDRKIILYAPNWESTSALHKYGKEVFDILKNTGHIILIKLHYMSLLSPNNEYATGGIDWNALLREYNCIENMRLIYDQNVNPYLLLADLMITDYGGVALEYTSLNKPIIYLDCPDYFEVAGKDRIEYWSRKTGYIIDKPMDIPQAISVALSDDKVKKKLRQDLIEKLLYNPGKAAETGKNIILQEILKK